MGEQPEKEAIFLVYVGSRISAKDKLIDLWLHVAENQLTASGALLRKIERDVERKKAGLPVEEEKQLHWPLSEIVERFALD